MAASPEADAPPTEQAGQPAQLGSATYEIIRQRLDAQGLVLRERVSALDARRREVFGSIESKLLQADRINTAHNCIPQDMVQIGGNRFLFGFNVRFGLKKEIELGDVFAVYRRDEETGAFREDTLEALEDSRFLTDFKRIYNVYEKTVFHKFSVIDGNLFMVFRTGSSAGDIAVFKWAAEEDAPRYVDGRAEADYRRIGFPPAHSFRWLIPDRESYRYGDHPHISIDDRVFVECVGGDLTIKIEDNTRSGTGIFAEPVDDKHQKVDDADIAYAILGHLILLKIKPYKEQTHRYFIYNEKLQQAERVDSIGQSCALLPEDHGLIFPDGYYLSTGELKRFDSRDEGHVLERIIHAPNGEDSLYVFYSVTSGEYVLLPYRLIAQKVEERITCHGFSLFPNGHLVLFRADNDPQKHHLIQLRQTPFHQTGFEPHGQRDAFLYQVGNKEAVRCLAECTEVLALLQKTTPYADLYSDLVARCGAILDAYPWLTSEEGFQINEALSGVREAADRAVDEFDKVLRLQRDAVRLVEEIQKRSTERFHEIRRAAFQSLNDFVGNLAALRTLTGELITLRETRYIDTAALEAIGKEVAEETERLAAACIAFLLKPDSLEPYRKTAEEQLALAENVDRVSDAKKIETAVAKTGGELEMLIEIVNSLKIDDATEATRIIDAITAVYTTLNQVKGALKNRLHSLVAAEGAAQFAAQMKLLAQSAASYLDLCDSPAKCEEYLNRISVQIEELEGTFADFDEYIVEISNRRTELYEAFEQRKIALVEARSRRASALMTAAERILKVVQNRLGSAKSVEEINTYLASDLMVAKVRETATQLLELGDPVKADDLSTRLKSLGQTAVRQLKDRQELFTGGPGVIQLGRHQFNVNTQPLDLTVVHREGQQFVHLTGTRYFDPVDDPAFLATRDVWEQEFVSENPDVYRSETLAARLLDSILADPTKDAAAISEKTPQERLALVQEFMSGRYEEGLTKGIHDLDAEKIFSALLAAHLALGPARFHPTARACAVVFWMTFCPAETKTLWEVKLRGFGERNRLFPGDPAQQGYVDGLRTLLAAFVESTKLYASEFVRDAAAYLFVELTGAPPVSFVSAQEADDLVTAFQRHLSQHGGELDLQKAMDNLASHPESRLELLRDWLRGFLLGQPGSSAHLEEAAAILYCGSALQRRVASAATTATLNGMKGAHRVLNAGSYAFDYLEFRTRLDRFDREVVPQFRQYHTLKQTLVDKERKVLRLEAFKPHVLTSFVRNQLIDEVYLPLVGDNLAKQMGTAGDTNRTDRSGLLLLISPPGYGKTTLLEYIASRLGIVFVKINGPAIGHDTTSLDPQEAPNAAAREEIEKLNLALEMGDNVMLCVDDIQHCNAEFLQKFISLCDAQRKIEGVWRGVSRTYDLRGRKVVVVMAGNPYTETGHKFRLPDMLANRADTYNLGDIIGGNANWFKASYIENAVTSNPVIAPLSNRSQKDIRIFIQMAEAGNTANAAGFESSYSPQEVEEILSVMKKLVAVREVILAVNLEYIRSAAQADEFRTEPAFKLQGSYRNMNRLAEKIAPVMNDAEVRALILDHYRNESQTLTADTEANLLKLKELIGALNETEAARWEEIKRTFGRNQLTRGGDDGDPVGRVVGQLSAFGAGLDNIQRTIAAGMEKKIDLDPVAKSIESIGERIQKLTPDKLALDPTAVLAGALQDLRGDLTKALSDVQSSETTTRMKSLMHEMEMLHSTLAGLRDIAVQQRDHLQGAREQLAARAKQGVIEFELTDEMLANEKEFLEKFQQALAVQRTSSPEEPGS